MKAFSMFVVLWCVMASTRLPASEPIVIDLWPSKIPGPPSMTDGQEQDRTKPDDRLIAGRRIIKLANVSRPQAHVFLPPPQERNGGAVIVCPGGGFSILAWDLEGTEVASWLNELGFAALVLKYRVPTRQYGEPDKWKGPVMDAQRALSLARAHAVEWNLDPQRIGILGFSAGGQTAALASVKKGQRLYESRDELDKSACDANFAILIYPGGIATADGALKSDYEVDGKSPPMFFAHAADDRVTCLSSVALFTALKKSSVPAELHIYSSGGHGYGLRRTDAPVTRWTDRAEAWLRDMKLLSEN